MTRQLALFDAPEPPPLALEPPPLALSPFALARGADRRYLQPVEEEPRCARVVCPAEGGAG